MRALRTPLFHYTFTLAATADDDAGIRESLRDRLRALDHKTPGARDYHDEFRAWVDRERQQCIADLKRWGVTTEWERVHD